MADELGVSTSEKTHSHMHYNELQLMDKSKGCCVIDYPNDYLVKYLDRRN